MNDLEYGEAWLLERMVFNRLPVHCLSRNGEAMNAWLNQGHHVLSPQELISVLCDMFAKGDLEAFAGLDSEVAFCPTRCQVSAALARENLSLYATATIQGGQRWESLASPIWDRYYVTWGWSDNAACVTTVTLERLREVVTNSRLLWQVDMDWDAVVVSELKDWQPLRWKAFPQAYEATIPFKMYRDMRSLDEMRKEIPDYIALRKWAESICGLSYL